MTIAGLINHQLATTKQSERSAAEQLGVTRQTLINWRKGVYTPDPRERERISRLAIWLGEPEARIMAMALAENGVDTSIFEEMAAFAKGVYLSSVGVLVPAS